MGKRGKEKRWFEKSEKISNARKEEDVHDQYDYSGLDKHMLNFLRQARDQPLSEDYYADYPKHAYSERLREARDKGYIKFVPDKYAKKDTDQKPVYFGVLTSKGIKALARYRHRMESHDDETSLKEKIAAAVFIILGFVFMIFCDFGATTTGNVISSSSGANLSFFLSLGLMVIGGVLLFQSFRKKG